MVRYFCDYCSQEIKDSDMKERNNLHRLTATIEKGSSRLTVEVIESLNGTGNAGHFCRYCVIDAINKLDDRPRERAALLIDAATQIERVAESENE